MLFQAFKKTFPFVLIAPILLASPLSHAGDAHGADGSGGGDALSPRIREVRSWFQDDSKAIRAELLKIGQVIQFFDAQGKSTALIKDLISKGLLEDIQSAPYEFKSKCVDEDGTEHAASTLKTDLSLDPKRPHPAICINLKKLAAQGATREEVIGLLFHEHSRHFGQEDTDEAGFHPIADFILERCANNKRSEVFYFDISKASMLLNGVAVSVSDLSMTIFDTIRGRAGLSVTISDITPECLSSAYASYDLTDELVSRSVTKKVKVGTTIRLSLSWDEAWAEWEKDKRSLPTKVSNLNFNIDHTSLLGHFLPKTCEAKVQVNSGSESQVYPEVFKLKSEDLYKDLWIQRVDVNLEDVAN